MVTTSVNKRPKTRGGKCLETKVFYSPSSLHFVQEGRRETLLLGESGAPNRALEGERERYNPYFSGRYTYLVL